MPLYELECDACGHRTEALVPRGSALPACERCGGEHMRRRPTTARMRSSSCGRGTACDRTSDGQRPSQCPPGRCCGIGD